MARELDNASGPRGADAEDPTGHCRDQWAVRNAGILCKQAITVDQVSQGRLEMGIGAGYYEEEHRMLGIDYPDATGRGERLREAVQVLDQGTRGEPVSLAGTYWRLERLPMHPGPVHSGAHPSGWGPRVPTHCARPPFTVMSWSRWAMSATNRRPPSSSCGKDSTG